MSILVGTTGLHENTPIRKDKVLTGKYCELIALAAFTEHGLDTALPYGNQRDWDMLVYFSGNWQRVQVKSATALKTRGFKCSLMKCSGLKRGKKTLTQVTYSRDQVDFICAVYPETGTVWMVPIDRAEFKNAISLPESCLFKRGTLPDSIVAPSMFLDSIRQIKPHRIKHTPVRDTLASIDLTDCGKPHDMLDETFQILTEFKTGLGYIALSKRYGNRPDTMEDRIAKAVKRLAAHAAKTRSEGQAVPDETQLDIFSLKSA